MLREDACGGSLLGGETIGCGCCLLGHGEWGPALGTAKLSPRPLSNAEPSREQRTWWLPCHLSMELGAPRAELGPRSVHCQWQRRACPPPTLSALVHSTHHVILLMTVNSGAKKGICTLWPVTHSWVSAWWWPEPRNLRPGQHLDSGQGTASLIGKGCHRGPRRWPLTKGARKPQNVSVTTS